MRLESKSVWLRAFVAAAAAAAVSAAPASADVRAWSWEAGTCGGQPGAGVLSEQVVSVQPGTQVCVQPPSSAWSPNGLRVWVGVYVDGHYFGQTSNEQPPRCVPASSATVRVRSDQLCTNDGGRLGGFIDFMPPPPAPTPTPTPPPPPPPPPPPVSSTQTWDWGSGTCGGPPGAGVLAEQVLSITPNTEVCVLPPSHVWSPSGVRVYEGIYIDGHYFGQTSTGNRRCASVPGPTVRIRSDLICTNEGGRDRGVIYFTPATAAPPPPPTSWDFSYVVGDPTTASARQYISTSNAVLSFEHPVWFWRPQVGGTTLATTTPGLVTWRIPFPQAVGRAHLFLNMPTFHWSYSRGFNRLLASRDGVSWQLLNEVQTPAFGMGNSGGYNQDLPAGVLGGTELWIRAELYSFGPSAPAGYTNTAQATRWQVGTTATTFKLDVNYGPVVLPAAAALQLDERVEEGNADIQITPYVEQGTGRASVSIGSAVRTNGSALSSDPQTARAIISGRLPFSVDTTRPLYFNVAVGGLMGGDRLFKTTARIEANVLEDGVPVATFHGDYGQGIRRFINLRPLPLGIEEVQARESHPYLAVAGRQYEIRFIQALTAEATLSPSHAFANFGGSTVIAVSDEPPETAPEADAGPDQTVAPGSTVHLDGSASVDPGSGALAYAWKQMGGEIVALTGASTATPSFEAFGSGLYRFELVVSTPDAESRPDYVNVLVGEDRDADGIPDERDNCPDDANPGQADADADGTGDACEANRAPEALDDHSSTDEDVALVIHVLENDSDPDGDALSVSVGAPGHGAAAVNADQSVSYTPNPNFFGSDAFTYTVDDGAGHSVEAVVRVEVAPVDDAPALTVPASVSSDEGTTVALALSASDPEGDPLAFSAAGLPPGLAIDATTGLVHGALGFEAAGVYAVTIGVSAGDGADSAVVLWTVVDVNRAPTAQDDFGGSDGVTPVAIPVLANDTDPDGDALAVSGVAGAAFGEVRVDGVTIVYTPRLFEVLQARVEALSLRRIPTRALVALLEGARKALERDKDHVARVELRAFLVLVELMARQGRIEPIEAAALRDPVRAFLDGGLHDSLSYSVSDGRGGSAQASVVVTFSPNAPK